MVDVSILEEQRGYELGLRRAVSIVNQLDKYPIQMDPAGWCLGLQCNRRCGCHALRQASVAIQAEAAAIATQTKALTEEAAEESQSREN